jgi:asparagine synthase (glutamine-hydrolysing)
MRKKEAFSDGVSGEERSLYQILQEYCATKTSKYALRSYAICSPKTVEQSYYRSVFESFYPKMGEVIPYFWMPKYVDATDASARTLATYGKGTQVV